VGARSGGDMEWSLEDCKMRVEAEGENTRIALRAARQEPVTPAQERR